MLSVVDFMLMSETTDNIAGYISLAGNQQPYVNMEWFIAIKEASGSKGLIVNIRKAIVVASAAIVVEGLAKWDLWLEDEG